MNGAYEKHISNLLSSVTQNLTVSKTGVILIKHYNSLDLGKEIVEKYFSEKKGIKYVYHRLHATIISSKLLFIQNRCVI